MVISSPILIPYLCFVNYVVCKAETNEVKDLSNLKKFMNDRKK